MPDWNGGLRQRAPLGAQTARPGAHRAADGAAVRQAYPSGRKLTITYTGGVPTAMALAKDASSTATALINQIEWQAFGPPKSWQWQMANATKTHQRVFDISGRLVRYPLGNVVRDVTYDAADRVTGYKHYDAFSAVAKPELDQAFAFDELGRLTQTWFYAGYWNFSYDANGNRTGSTVTGNTSAYAIEPTSNRISSITNPGRSFNYDAAGNTTADSQFNATYDLSGRMKTLTKAGVTTTYVYDNFGRRVRKFSSSGAASTVLFVYDQNGQLLGEFDQAGNPLREFVWLGSTPIAMFTPDPAGASNPPAAFYIHADHIDTPRVVVDKNNQIRWRWMAEPFGMPAPETNPSGLGTFAFNLRFPGQYFDQESGLHYNWFRFYDAGLGRYTTPDPLGLGAGDMSLYAYVSGNPLMYVDPNGLDMWGKDPAFNWRTKDRVPQPDGENAELYVFTMCMRTCVGESFVITSTSEDIPQHPRGTPHRNEQAMDLRHPGKSEKYLCCAKSCGAQFALDEAKNPSKLSTGKHFHLQLVPGKKGGRGDLPAGGNSGDTCNRCEK